ncbi:hypothetical protein NO559_05705 [Dasania sp. GY-MA-18]|uniref:Cytochrome c domain-containing protein n=1 Tax=Dasania phycosphaerae TaxID=2950436 RepID=A0A9J6RL10_9GAMM|nr:MULTISPECIES: hypothetical protein [Dasania]MCR8922257.1 hypothetical protein [Dasania sp. GY-MA-18]MCZ0864685.1 hypothetical protein [Dasania phycosphaerae]MCZ0868413.1 hypothetical protein [Dasania phycosphaerae]
MNTTQMLSLKPLWALSLASLLALSACSKDQAPASPPIKSNSNMASSQQQGPWQLPPPPPNYQGPLFSLSHNYPAAYTQPLPTAWQQAINSSRINVNNAQQYTLALKAAIAKDMRQLIYDYPNWQPAKAGWYNQPWLSDIRDPIRGSYIGSTFPPAMFPQSKLSAEMTTHVAVYYDSVAAVSLNNVWGSSGTNPMPGLAAGGAQFPEGGIIVKPAFTTADASTWPPMAGAYPVTIYANNDGSSPRQMMDVQFFQFDIIVKDSQSSPQSQWVFTTLVYDKNAPGDNWDKMVPLGAMWGNDPNINSPQFCDYTVKNGCPALAETWINPAAPLYAKETLGWGGRLSGPNDGAVDIDAVVLKTDGSLALVAPKRYAMSSCMGCHGSAEYTMKSFLLPSPSSCSGDSCTPTFAQCDQAIPANCKVVPPSAPGDKELVYHQTASADFMRWFQNRPGNIPQDPGQIALDYGMNYAFKSLPSWYRNTQAADKNADIGFTGALRNYRGLDPALDDK